MTLGSIRHLVAAVCLLIALAACNSEYNATANLPEGATVNMAVTPLFGFHSDWSRTLTVSDGDTTESIQLFEDTGWWRGSHVYLDASGTYFVHEGQLGCFAFTLEPVSFPARSPASCPKMPEAAARLSEDSPELNGYPASRYYVGLYYVGRFIEAARIPELLETRRETPIVFQTHEQQIEPELPEII